MPAPGRCHQHPNQDVSPSCLARTNRPGVGLGGEGWRQGPLGSIARVAELKVMWGQAIQLH